MKSQKESKMSNNKKLSVSKETFKKAKRSECGKKQHGNNLNKIPKQPSKSYWNSFKFKKINKPTVSNKRTIIAKKGKNPTKQGKKQKTWLLNKTPRKPVNSFWKKNRKVKIINNIHVTEPQTSVIVEVNLRSKISIKSKNERSLKALWNFFKSKIGLESRFAIDEQPQVEKSTELEDNQRDEIFREINSVKNDSFNEDQFEYSENVKGNGQNSTFSTLSTIYEEEEENIEKRNNNFKRTGCFNFLFL